MDTMGQQHFRWDMNPCLLHSVPNGSEPGANGERYRDGWVDEPRLSTIREMVRDFGISIRALRFYEDCGLLHPRQVGNARMYDARNKLHLRMILAGKELGFSLSEIEEILASNEEEVGDPDLERDPVPEQIDAQISHLERQRVKIDQAIRALQLAHRRASGSSPSRSALCQSIRVLERIPKKLRQMF